VASRISNTLGTVRNEIRKVVRRFYAGQHQLTSTTGINRYPELFRETQQALRQRPGQPVSILSFGCSTGQECFSLNDYFPNASILGVDINKSNLAQARENNAFSNVRFLLSTPETISAEGPYDIMFCLSVLCRWEDTKDLENCESIYPFAKYESLLKDLVASLVPGGLLVIYNSNFRFEETSLFAGFEKVETPTVKDSGFVHKFDHDNRRIREPHRQCVYRKKLV
jgi:chemotaxis methyl-accepting protein methylase